MHVLSSLWQRQKECVEKLEPMDKGLGDPGYENSSTHYNTSIAKSYFALEQQVMSVRPDLRHYKFRSIREFVGAIKQEFPKVSPYCDKYIELYELARFSNYKCTQQEFNEFFDLCKNMLNALHN
ncbi:hypothetical protein RFI_09462 [Reticulomyxa filosa]|uniref:Uncharacterized protein n=1 Tax=Reticulomyxa filosa TaxID=46433 RepID=X6NQN3_RETFI|nr:hypothetical protein RFI_09462 [Reticulomyxa filosa]|eukprot:ETO27672.1 hypothetical protein RFI_09462 [Reticulomyxa filosa]